MPRRWHATVLVVAVLLAAGSCAAGGTGSLVVHEAGGVTMMASRVTDGGMDALVAGPLMTTDSGCLGVPGDRDVTPVVFPEGSTLSDDGALVTPGGEVIALGDQIDGGGGWVDPSPYADDAPEACVGVSDEYVVMWEVGPGG